MDTDGPSRLVSPPASPPAHGIDRALAAAAAAESQSGEDAAVADDTELGETSGVGLGAARHATAEQVLARTRRAEASVYF